MKETPFTDHLITLNEGEMLYLFSDGFHSQFGGEKNETLKMKRFKEMLKELSTLTVTEQKAELNAKFERWKGNNEQTDDVLVLGIRV